MRTRVELAPLCDRLRSLPIQPQPKDPSWLLAGFALCWLSVSALGAGRDWLVANSLSTDKKLEPYYEYIRLVHSYDLPIGFKTMVSLPDGKRVDATYRGKLNDLPTIAGKLGDLWKVGSYYWVWAVPSGGGKPQWIDP